MPAGILSHFGKRSKDREARQLRQRMNIPATAGGGGVTDHGALTGLADDDHANYVHLTAARTILAQHSFSPSTPQAPFLLAANAQGQLVTGLNADELDGLDASATPGASEIVATNASGYVQLASRLGIGVTPGYPLHILSTTEPQIRIEHTSTIDYADFAVNSSGNLTITPTANIVMTPTGGTVSVNPGDFRVTTDSPPQMRIYYDASNYSYYSVAADGHLTISAVGTDADLTISSGDDIYLMPGDGNLTVSDDAYGTVSLILRADAGNTRSLYFSTSTVYARWGIKANATAEGGSNTGSDFEIERYSDAGGSLGKPLQIVRSTGYAQFENRVGIGIAPSYPLHIRASTSQQIRIEYDASNYGYIDISTTGILTLLATNHINLSPVGDVRIWPSGGDTWITGQVGIGKLPDYDLEIESVTTPQFRISYDATNYADFWVSSAGRLSFQSSRTPSETIIFGQLGIGVIPVGDLEVTGTTYKQFRINDGAGQFAVDVGTTGNSILFAGGNLELRPTGDLIFSPTGSDILPQTSHTTDLGTIAKLFREIHASELWVGSLVAHTMMATIGGEIVVAPTSELILLLGSGATTIDVKHNTFATNDFIVMRSDGNTEWMQITDNGTPITGGYRYTLTRGLDGSGHQFYAGDAVVNTGYDGGGYLDIFSLNALSTGTGPTITGTIRDGTLYNDLVTAWAIGNLESNYGYSVETYGAAFGLYGTGYNYLTIDDTDGISFYDTTQTLVGRLSATTWTLGATSSEQVVITATAIEMKDASGNNVIELSSGDAIFGRVATNFGNVRWNSTDKTLEFRGGVDGTVVQAEIDTTGMFFAGEGAVQLGKLGLWLEPGTGEPYEETHSLDMGPTADHDLAYIHAAYYSTSSKISIRAGSTGSGYASVYLDGSGTLKLNAYSEVIFSSDVKIDNGRSLIINEGLDVGSISGTPAWGYINISSAPAGDGGLLMFDSPNSKQSRGITIQQGTYTDEILTFKKLSSFDHLMTDITEFDTYAYMKPWSVDGGLYILGLSDSSQTRGLSLHGAVVADSTTKSSSGIGIVNIEGHKRNGTTWGNLSSNANVLSVRSNGSTGMIVDAEGTIHSLANASGLIVDFSDDLDDIALLTGFRASMQRVGSKWREKYSEMISYARPHLEASGIATYNDKPGENGSIFVALQGLQYLTIDGLRQFHGQQTLINEDIYSRLRRYEKAFLKLGLDPQLLEA